MANKTKLMIVTVAVTVVAVVMIILSFLLSEKEKITYTVTFDSNGGSIVEKQVINQGEKAERPEDPTKDGFVFVEWKYNGELFDFNTEMVKDITLKAEWMEIAEDLEMIVVKFDTAGGSTISNQIIEKGTKVIKPSDPTRDGYIFKGWFVDSKNFNFNSIVNNDIVIIARWEKEKVEATVNNSSDQNNNSSSNGSSTTEKKYTVSFNSNGGSKVPSQSVKAGNKATKPSNPTRSGYTFECWMLNGKKYDFSSKVTSNITLTANWKENPKVYYTVSFDANGGSNVASQSILAGQKVSQPSNPTREGYTFNGWTLNGGSYNFNSSVNGNITLKANWVQKRYTITTAAVDSYSPDVVLSVFENGTKISVSSINYSDGVLLCSGSNTTVNKNDIAGERSFIVVLNGGTRVSATLN